MKLQIGEVVSLHRYPVKSMAGQRLEFADVGWHGIEGDRRLALHRVADRGGFPWLTASKLPALVTFAPHGSSEAGSPGLPTHVRTPEGAELTLFGNELAEEISRRHGSRVEVMHLNRGIFDEACLSLITVATIEEISAQAGVPADARRFRPNIVITTLKNLPFEEDAWVGGTLTFGADQSGPVVSISNWDERCSMVNFDPDSATANPAVLKAIVAARGNKAGVYGNVTRRGRVTPGQPIFFQAGASS